MKSERKGNRILLVDDETDIKTLFKIALEEAGFIVHAYNDPLIALSKFKPGHIILQKNFIKTCRLLHRND